MRLSDFRNDAHDFTKSLSDINRNLAYAGVAIIWVFKSQIENTVHIEKDLLLPLLFIVLSLVLDLFQNLYSSIIWTHFHRKEEANGTNEEDEIDGAPKWYPIPAYVMFYLKIGFTILGFMLLFIHISKELFA